MKRHLIWITTAVLILSGCVKNSEDPSQIPTGTPPTTENTIITTAPSSPAVTVAQAPMCAVNLPLVYEEKYAEDGSLIFTHTYQNISMTLQEAEIADKVIVDFLNRTDSADYAQQILETAQADYSESGKLIAPYHYSITYTPMRLDSSILSLFGTSSAFTGGIHPENITNAVTYDLLTGNCLRSSSIFLETVTTEDILPHIYKALESQENTLYEGYKTMVADKFSQGIDHNNDWYFSSEGLCFFFSPYEIGPFASGTVIAQIPYDQLTQILRGSYFPAERDTAFGTLKTIPYAQVDLDKYSQFTEVIITPSADKYLLVTDSSIQNLQIIQNIPIAYANGYCESYTVFASYGLTPGDAVMLQTSDPVQVRYETGNQLISDTIPVK